MTTKPFEECPRFSNCSVNHCPLDPDRDKCFVLESDPQNKCTMEKRVRMRIADRHIILLPWRGLTNGEKAAMDRWEKLTTEQQNNIRNRMRTINVKHRQQKQ